MNSEKTFLSSLPTQINDYEFIQKIGQGGFATVYLAKHHHYQAFYAAKVIQLSPSMQNMSLSFFNEIERLKSLDHPNIIRLYDYFRYEQSLVMILEYCQFGSLADLLKTKGPLPYSQFCSMYREIVSALAYCHQNNISHGDVKPGNILLAEKGHVKISDFGLSQLVEHGRKINHFECSPPYSAPEVLRQLSYDPCKADIWSLGVLFFQMSTGELPWPIYSFSEMRSAILLGNIWKPPTMATDIWNLVQKMIIVNPQERITAVELSRLPIFTNRRSNNIHLIRTKDRSLNSVLTTDSVYKKTFDRILLGYNSLAPQDRSNSRLGLNTKWSTGKKPRAIVTIQSFDQF